MRAMRSISRGIPRSISDALVRRPDLVICLIAAYYVLAVGMRVLRSEGLQNDEAEQIFQSQFLLLGYGPQPPFYNWLQYGVIQLIGPSIFALSLVKNGLLFLCCLFYGLTARMLIRDKTLSAIAMLGVLTLPAVTVLSQRDLTHAVATLFAVSLFLYAFLGALKRPTFWSYLLTGIATGIGLLSKYNFVILPVAAIIAVLPEAELRKRLFDRRVLATIAVTAVMCLPHGLWVLGNLNAATSSTIEAMRSDASGSAVLDRLEGIGMLLMSALTGALPPLLFFLFAFRRDLMDAWKAQNLWTRLTGRMFLLSLLLVGLIGVGLGATNISEKWLSPFLLILPLYLCLKLDAAGAEARPAIPRLFFPVAVLAVGFLMYIALGNLAAPYLGRYEKENLPSSAFIRNVLAERGDRPLPAFIATSNTVLAASARMELPDVPVIIPNFAEEAKPQKQHGLVVWQIRRGDVSMPAELVSTLEGMGVTASDLKPATLAVPYLFSGGKDKALFGYAWVDAVPVAPAS